MSIQSESRKKDLKDNSISLIDLHEIARCLITIQLQQILQIALLIMIQLHQIIPGGGTPGMKGENHNRALIKSLLYSETWKLLQAVLY